MPIKYYSQAGEDALLWNVFKGQSTGFFIEVGAFDGRHLSNTLSFEEQGWTGICVEPHPDYFELCRSNRPKSTCVHAACVSNGEPPTTTFLSEPLGILSGVRADATFDLPGRYASRGMIFPGFKIEVRARSLDDIMAEFYPSITFIDFLSVDVEGTEIEVLSGFSLDARIIVAEANTGEAALRLQEYMAGRGYNASRAIDQNFFFTRDQMTASFLATATFDITTERTLHPLGTNATHPNHTGRRICLG
jgi:FkbM family methyltransferase